MQRGQSVKHSMPRPFLPQKQQHLFVGGVVNGCPQPDDRAPTARHPVVAENWMHGNYVAVVTHPLEVESAIAGRVIAVHGTSFQGDHQRLGEEDVVYLHGPPLLVGMF